MPSISELGNLAAVDPVDLTELAPKGPTFPRAGRYTLRVPEDLDPAFIFGETASGALSATIDPTIAGPTNAGFVVRFVKMSAKTYREKVYGTDDFRVTSKIAQFLASCGDYRSLPGDPEAIMEAVLDQAGKEFRATLDWRAWNKRKQEATDGMTNFPPDGYGGYLPWILDEDDMVENPNTGVVAPRRIRANLQVVRFIPARLTT